MQIVIYFVFWNFLIKCNFYFFFDSDKDNEYYAKKNRMQSKFKHLKQVVNIF